jgi:putative oxidoreductase
VHLSAGFFAPTGFEFPLALLGAALTLLFTGAGRFSLDAILAGRRTGGASVDRSMRRVA